MINGMSGSCGSFAQMQGMRQRKGPAEQFAQLDADKNGGLDQTELQSMTDKMSEMTGQSIDVKEVTETYDANNDGLLGQDGMQTMMMELHGTKGGGPGKGMMSMQSLSAYQMDPDKDPASLLMDMFAEQDGDQDEDQEDDYSPVNLTA